MAFIEEAEARGAPWYCNISIFDPHHSFNPPGAYLQPYLERLQEIPLPAWVPGELADKPPIQSQDHQGAYGGTCGFPFPHMSAQDRRVLRAAYWAMCDLIDAQLARVLTYLDRLAARERTLIIFTSDHGEMLGDHGIYLKGPYFYEPLLRVPCVLKGPGVSRGLHSDALVELIDLAPTILEAAGLERHPGMQGQSLWPLLRGQAETHRNAVYSEYLDAMCPSTAIPPPGPPWCVPGATNSWSTMPTTAENSMIWGQTRASTAIAGTTQPWPASKANCCSSSTIARRPPSTHCQAVLLPGR
jgi:arylsulfatase A-like enzyme